MPPINVQIDFTSLAELIVNALVAGVQRVLSPLPGTFQEWLWHSIQGILTAQGSMNVLTHIPLEWTAGNADVVLLWKQGLLVQGGLGAIVIAVGGYYVMSGKMDIWYVVFRFGFLVIAGNAMIVGSILILNFVNAAADSVAGSTMDIRSEMMPNDFTLGFMLIIAAVFAGLAWVKGAVGVIFIDVLIVSAPYILTLSAIPLLSGLAKWWVEEFTTWCMRPLMVALVLRLGLGIGLVHTTGGAQFLFAIITFWLAYKMDTYMRRFSVGVWGNASNLGLFSRAAALARSASAATVAAPAAGRAAATT